MGEGQERGHSPNATTGLGHTKARNLEPHQSHHGGGKTEPLEPSSAASQAARLETE